MSGTTLCVVDMQPSFGTFRHCKEAVEHEIKLAKRRNDGIIFLEYYNYGKTIPELTDLAKFNGYNRIGSIWKHRDGGGQEVVKAARKYGFTTERIRVCGVNRGACVSSTIEDLLNELPDSRIEIAWAATAPGPAKWKDEKAQYIIDKYRALLDYGLIIR